MRVLRCLDPGGPEPLAFAEAPEPPAPGAGEILIAIEACGLNHADVLMTRGAYQHRPEPPFSPGLEVAGAVLAAGERAGFAPGDRVLGVLDHGGLAERATIESARCVALPDDMAAERAAALPIVFGTAWAAFGPLARIEAGAAVAVTGAGGGAGLAAIEIARAMGARVLAIARGEDKRAAALAAGAEVAVDPQTEDLRARMKAFADGGVDVVYDAVGGAAFPALLAGLRWGGRLIVVGFAGGRPSEPRYDRLMVKNLTISGLNWGGWRIHAPDLWRESVKTAVEWSRSGAIARTPPTLWPFERAIEALNALSKGGAGKQVARIAS